MRKVDATFKQHEPMLTRSPDRRRRRQPDDRRREQQRRWQRDYRRRLRRGVKLIEATRPVSEFLLRSEWLQENESEDARAIGDALDAFARDALKKFR